MVKRAAFVASFLIAIGLLFSTVAGALSQRNPFRVPDIVAPDGPDIMQLAAQIRMGGGPEDRNAPQWSESIAAGSAETLDGEWYSRWEAGTFGVARIAVVGNRLFALHTNNVGRMSGKTWLLEAVIGDDKRLAGRWVQIGNPRDTGPFIGLIVSPERIDGIWSPNVTHRWDFRRRLADGPRS